MSSAFACAQVNSDPLAAALITAGDLLTWEWDFNSDVDVFALNLSQFHVGASLWSESHPRAGSFPRVRLRRTQFQSRTPWRSSYWVASSSVDRYAVGGKSASSYTGLLREARVRAQ